MALLAARRSRVASARTRKRHRSGAVEELSRPGPEGGGDYFLAPLVAAGLPEGFAAALALADGVTVSIGSHLPPFTT